MVIERKVDETQSTFLICLKKRETGVSLFKLFQKSRLFEKKNIFVAIIKRFSLLQELHQKWL